jgi:A118 family predicted phage portal protein
MPLPQGGAVAWPPEGLKFVYDMYTIWGAWYSGDPNQIMQAMALRVNRGPNGSQWAKELVDEHETMLHVPVAGDISGVAADFLFGEPPKLKVAEAHLETASSTAKKTQARLDEIVAKGGVINRLRTGGESASAMGGVFLKPNWDKKLVPYPILDVAQADNAVPEFRWGILTACTFWLVVKDEGTKGGRVWRHLERHELDLGGNGIILNGLYMGTHDTLGTPVPLDSLDETRHMTGLEVINPKIGGLLCCYVPNMLPNRLMRGSALGQSDYNSTEPLMDALDMVYTSWIRDIELGQGRLIVPEMWLRWEDEKRADGTTKKQPKFDIQKKVFTALDVDPNSVDKAGVTINQFAIRTQEHLDTAMNLLERIVTTAGYSPQSFGLHIEGSAESGTALRVRERKSFNTNGKKQAYWKPAIERMAIVLLALDMAVFKSGVDANLAVACEMQDSVTPDLTETGAAVLTLFQAQAASAKVRVMALHPDWTEEQVNNEVDAILKEFGAQVPDPMQAGELA